MAETASETAQDVVRETRERAYDLVEGAKQNPIPALMIGAGVAWLLMDRTRKGNGYRERPGSSAYRRSSASDYERSSYGNYSDTDDYYQPSGVRTGSGRRWSSHRTSSEGVGGWAREATGEARETARRAQNGLQRLMRQNPLLVGAAAMLVGAAVGASLPETETENEWMGEARDTVIDKAQTAAQTAAAAVKEAANDVVGDTVSKVAERVTTPTPSR